MAGRSAILSVKVLTDATKAQKGLGDAEKTVGRFQSGMSKLLGPATAVAGALALVGKTVVDAASRQQQAMGAIDAVYGKSADVVKAYADTAAQSMGLSKAAYGEATSQMGAQLIGLGLSQGDAAKAAQTLIQTGADLAATFGGTTADAVSALGATLRGEYDSVEKYGISINAAGVNAELSAKGQDKLTGAAKDSAKANATLSMIAGDAASSMGQFAKESDTAAGSQEIANAKFEDAKAALGEKLLPVIAAVTSKLAELADWIGQNTIVVGIVVGVLATLAATVFIVNFAFNAWAAAILIVNAAFWSSPIFWIVAAIVALVAIVVIIATKTKWFQQLWEIAFKAIKTAISVVWDWIKQYWPLLLVILTGPIGAAILLITKNFDKIKAVAETVYNWLKDVFAKVWDTIKDVAIKALDLILAPIHAITDAFDAVVKVVKSVIDWIGKIKIPNIGGALKALNPFSKAAPAGYYAAPTFGNVVGARSGQFSARRPASTGVGAGPTIIIQGAIDPVATARQIRQILRDDTRRRSGVQIGYAR